MALAAKSSAQFVPVFRIRIRTDPLTEMPPGSGSAWTDADPDPGGIVKEIYRLIMWKQNCKNKRKIPLVILKFIVCLLIFNDFLMSSWKIKFKKIVCNYFFLVFTSLHADPDPYEHFLDPGSGSACKLMRIRNTCLYRKVSSKSLRKS